jgi:adenosylmethionine-8-amino-7-oxononanoate aminotransferase
MTTACAWRFLVPPSTFGDTARMAVAAQGMHIRLADGRELLDGTSGLWNVNLGFGNHAVAEAISAALRDASYLTLFRYGHRYAEQAARALIAAAGRDRFARVLFSTSGGAANDVMMKLARQTALLRGHPERRLMVSLRGSYHGLTFGGFALTGEDLGQRAYGIDQRLVRQIAHGDGSQLQRLLKREGDKVAAVVVEPVLGSGAHVLPEPFVTTLLEGREQHGYLVVADEVATGFGRTGEMFAHDRWPAGPDILVVSKALTNGTCGAAALLLSPGVCETFDVADAVLVHAETQAGTPPSCAAMLAVLAEMERLDVVASARRVARRLDEGLRSLVTELPWATGTSGIGCFRGLALARPVNRPISTADVQGVVDATLAEGAVVQPGPSSVQLIPSLIATDAQIDDLICRLRLGLERFFSETAR